MGQRRCGGTLRGTVLGLLLAYAAFPGGGRAADEPPGDGEPANKAQRPTLKPLDKYVVNPSDVLRVELLDALPGRPIAGDRLVRPDGTISLGFYGELQVAGLTTAEIKEKLVLHLRKFLTDDALGLWKISALPTAEAREEAKRLLEAKYFKELKPPLDRPVVQSPFLEEDDVPASAPAAPTPPVPDRGSPAAAAGGSLPTTLPRNPFDLGPQKQSPAPGTDADMKAAKENPNAADAQPVPIPVHPKDSSMVFVDVAEFHSAVYYVEGAVVDPCRRIITGHETVLDALHAAGGPSWAAAREQIRLIRPEEEGKPAIVLPVHYMAIVSGMDSSSNYQILPGDRLFVPSDAEKMERMAQDPGSAEMAKWMHVMGLRFDTAHLEISRLSRKLDEMIEATQKSETETAQKTTAAIVQLGQTIKEMQDDPRNGAQFQLLGTLIEKLDTRTQILDRKLDQVAQAVTKPQAAQVPDAPAARGDTGAKADKPQPEAAANPPRRPRRRAVSARDLDDIDARLEALEQKLDELLREQQRSRDRGEPQPPRPRARRR